MTAQTKTVIKTYFETGDFPTQGQFADLIDSYQDTSASLVTLSSASVSLGGLQLLALTSAGVGTVGRQILAVNTSAAALAIIGGASSGANNDITSLGALVSVPTVVQTAITAGNVKLAGDTVQVINGPVAGVLTGTTTIPADDTIPQSSEGDEYNSVIITPTNASNRLRINACMMFSTSVGGGQFIAALFKDSETNARAAIMQYMATTDRPLMFDFNYEMVAGSTSAMTFKVRAGSESGGTTTLNGFGGNRKLGGVAASQMSVTEIKV